MFSLLGIRLIQLIRMNLSFCSSENLFTPFVSMDEKQTTLVKEQALFFVYWYGFKDETD